MKLLDLPSELLLAIGDEIFQSKYAVASASTNRALNAIFQPLAYKINVKYESSPALTWAASQNSLHVMRKILEYPGANVNTVTNPLGPRLPGPPTANQDPLIGNDNHSPPKEPETASY